MMFSQLKRRFDLRNNFIVARNLRIQSRGYFKKMLNSFRSFFDVNVVLQIVRAHLRMTLQQAGEQILAWGKAVDFGAVAGGEDEKFLQAIGVSLFINVNALLSIESKPIALREVCLFET